jgi:hypothetical protein
MEVEARHQHGVDYKSIAGNLSPAQDQHIL